MRLIHDQFDLTRMAKIELIAKHSKNLQAKPFLKICSLEKQNDKNCCNCRKCISSIIGFFAIGEDPKLFGMPLSLHEAVTRTRELLAPHKLNYYTILYFKGVQQRIQKRLDAGEQVPAELASLISLDMDKKYAFDTAKQQRISWKEMQELLPGLEIPEVIDNMSVPT